MKIRRLTTALAAASATVSPTGTSATTASSAGNDVSVNFLSSQSTGGSSDSHGGSVGYTVDPDQCLGLPRNTLLASCPAPCLPDAPCIVYDQDAAHDLLTGCDYATSTETSFCFSEPSAQSCEFHCFPKFNYADMFLFMVNFKQTSLDEPIQRTAQDAKLLEMPDNAYQSNDFVVSVGTLNLSTKMTAVELGGLTDDTDSSRLVNVSVDPSFLRNAPSVTSLAIFNLPLRTERAVAIVAAAPSNLTKLSLENTRLDVVSWEMFTPVPHLEVLSLTGNQLSSIAANDSNLSDLTEFYVQSNRLTEFDLRAPKLEQLDLFDNKFVRIPESVFTYTKLEYLVMNLNPVIRPLVLTAQQVQFLEALPTLVIHLQNPPDAEIVSVLPIGGESKYGNYSDGLNLSSLLVGATKTRLHGDVLLPVLVVDSDTASLYNNVLEQRAKNREKDPETPSPSSTQDPIYVPIDTCQGVPRNALLSYCATNCPVNGACVAYDQDSAVDERSGCDYDVASTPSVCTRARAYAITCEFQCFPAYEPPSQFEFFIPFKTELGAKVTRLADNGDIVGLRTTEIPFLSNSFVGSIGALNLTSTVTEVLFAGGDSEFGTQGEVVDVTVSENLLAKAPAVTSLALVNINLGSSDLAAIIGSALPKLKSLNLRNTNLEAIPETVLASLVQLETLVLAQNSLTTLDMTTTALSQLTTLDLSDNTLTTIEINAPNIKTLDLSGNDLVRIPLSVFSLTELETLNLQGNLLTTPLVLSSSQQEMLDAVPNLQLQAAAEMGVLQLASTSSVTSSIQLANGTVAIGSLVTVGGVSAIIVDEQIANQYNEDLEQQQQASTPRSRTRSSGGAGGSTSATSSNAVNLTDASPSQSNSSTGGDQDSRSSKSLPSSMASGSASDSKLNASGDEATTPASKEDPNSTNETSNASTATKLMLGGLGSAFAVAILVFFIIFRRRRAIIDKESSYVTMTDSGDGSSVVDARPGAREVVSWWKDDVLLSHRLNARDIGDVRVIGTDGSSTVSWLVDFRGGSRQLVSKRLIHTDEGGSTDDAKLIALIAEAKIAASLRYPSIVPFVGVAWTDKTDLQVLYEYMPNGDLGSYLSRTDPSSLPWLPTKLQLAIDIIEALVYTHSFNPPLLHRDLKTSNVLLDDNYKAKLGNFGSARPESDSNTMTAGDIGSGRWLAPEILLGSTSYGTPSDMYSFGVVLCELDTHKAPYEDELEVEGGVLLSEVELLQRVARGEQRPTLSSSCPVEIRKIAEACLAFDPEERPTAMEASHSLRLLRRQSLQTS